MRLSSQNSQFVFNLPSDFLPKEIVDTYTPILEKNWIQYENIIDYLNSTIKSVNYPGLSVETPKQNTIRGKEVYHKPAKNVQDILASHELSITFRSVDSDLNYWLCYDVFVKHYLDVESQYINPFILTAVDIWRDAIYRIQFIQLIAISLSENTFDYSSQKTNAKEFTMVFRFNYTDVEFLLNKSKVLETTNIPTIIQKI
jgi:hypothetical protein